jgi:hypothetical protein
MQDVESFLAKAGLEAGVLCGHHEDLVGPLTARFPHVQPLLND